MDHGRSDNKTTPVFQEKRNIVAYLRKLSHNKMPMSNQALLVGLIGVKMDI